MQQKLAAFNCKAMLHSSLSYMFPRFLNKPVDQKTFPQPGKFLTIKTLFHNQETYPQ